MGAGNSQPLTSHQLTQEQLETVQRKFARLSGDDGRASIADIQQLPELVGNPMVPRIFALLDTDGDGSLSLKEFIRAVEWFGTVKAERDMYRLAFTVYDLNQDGVVDAMELFTMLKAIVQNGYTDRQLDHVVQATMVQYDTDGDWKLTFTEFCKLVNAVDLFSKFTFTLC
eukprot:GHRR01012489.1.p1 GENE.GHRR01012489.1~~GHRR01012489.1.p1  ORF type:complete len:170 (+),score=45.14 GHRR01012489.1:432-941(+)